MTSPKWKHLGNEEEGTALLLEPRGHGELPSDAGQAAQGDGQNEKQQGGGFLQTRWDVLSREEEKAS